jgi:hypothetical protein
MQTNGLIKIIVMACLLNINVQLVKASSLVTPERHAINVTGQLMAMYKTLHDGILPQNWEDLSSLYDLASLNKSIELRGTAPIQDRYQFITQNLPYIDEPDSRVLLIRTVPLSERKSSPRKWRYLIYQHPDGEILSTRLPENRVQEMLQNANITIIPKAHLPSVEYEDYLPGKEPKPTPNPNDAGFLRQHPKLDPKKIN